MIGWEKTSLSLILSLHCSAILREFWNITSNVNPLKDLHSYYYQTEARQGNDKGTK